MGYILIGKHKTRIDAWHDMNGIYEFPNKSDFGSLRALRRNCPDYDLKIVDKEKFNRKIRKEYKVMP